MQFQPLGNTGNQTATTVVRRIKPPGNGVDQPVLLRLAGRLPLSNRLPVRLLPS
jgi:hypothetical protein